MSEDNKARIRALLDRVLTAGEVDASRDYVTSRSETETRFAPYRFWLNGLAKYDGAS
jgi:hypothetical protein